MLLNLLACPKDRSALAALADNELICQHGHSFPVVDGVPVLLCDDADQTMPLAYASLARARGDSSVVDMRDPALYLESLGISEHEKKTAVGLARRQDRSVDPVVSVIVAATNGIAYKSLIGTQFDYPIPDIRLPEGRSKLLLDVGCNWGRWSIAAARKGYRVVGIDPSLGAVMAARRVARQFALPIDYVCGDGRMLPFRSACFDTVFSYSVIQHFSKQDAERTFDEIGRVLRPEGNSLIQMPNWLGIRCLAHLTQRGFSEGADFEVRYWSIPALQATLERSVGPSSISVHCFFGLGLEPSDRQFMSPLVRALLAISERLRRLSRKFIFLTKFADSVYITSIKLAQRTQAAI